MAKKYKCYSFLLFAMLLGLAENNILVAINTKKLTTLTKRSAHLCSKGFRTCEFVSKSNVIIHCSLDH
jgi:hypothetical protein